jgi:organic hydroperoxide reductase OsmC/OhrA
MSYTKKVVKKKHGGSGNSGMNPANLLIGGLAGAFLQGFNGNSGTTTKKIIKKK